MVFPKTRHGIPTFYNNQITKDKLIDEWEDAKDKARSDYASQNTFRLPFDDSSTPPHGLVDDRASVMESVNLTIAAFACGVGEEGVYPSVASDTLQLMARLGGGARLPMPCGA